MNNYMQQAQQHKDDRNWKMPKGDYLCILGSTSVAPGKTNPQNMIAVAEWKPMQSPTQEAQNMILQKKRTIKERFNINNPEFGFKDFLAFLVECGCDLSDCRPANEDPTHQDLIAKFNTLQIAPPHAKISSELDGEGPYYKTKMLEIYPRGVNSPLTMAAEAMANIAPPAAVVAPAPVVEAAPVAGPTYEQMIGAGWTDATMAANPAYVHLVPVAAPPVVAPPAPVVTTPPAPVVEAPPAQTGTALPPAPDANAAIY